MNPLSAARCVLKPAATLTLVWLASLPLGSQEPQKQPKVARYNQRSKADLPQRQKTLAKLPTASLRKAGNVVEVNLVVSTKVHEIVDPNSSKLEFVRTRSYNCGLCGPVIRVKPGDQLKVHLKNDIRKTEPDTPFDPKNPTAPHGFNITNLHTHGLNVSPKGRSDNVFLEVGPEESIELCFDIPEDHPAGTFWYHAHKHGSVALQLAGGMAGVLIVEGEGNTLDGVTGVKESTNNQHEKILVFQQIPYRPGADGQVLTVLAADVYADPTLKDKLEKEGKLYRDTFINGELFPTITMQPGEVQRWRCVHAGLESTLDLVLVKEGEAHPEDPKNRVKLYEIAVDGLPLGEMTEWSHLELQPGYRSDLLVKAPPPGTYIMQTLEVKPQRSISGLHQDPRYLARVQVKGPALNPEMKLPDKDALKELPAKAGLTPITKVDNLMPIEINLSTATDGQVEVQFLVNDNPFDKDKNLFTPQLGSTQEWTLSADAGRHPFHVHVNPFQVKRKKENGDDQVIWRDTLLLTANDASATKIQMRFKNFPGRTVLHCHNLRHEDQGMMAAFEILGKDPPFRCPQPLHGFTALPADAPGWKLLDTSGVPRQASDYKGKKLVVFSRGSECFHCRAQIQALTAKADDLGKAGVTIIVICPDPIDRLPKTKDSFLVLADEAGLAFKAYHCHDGRFLHGTFLIDTAGQIRWQNTGDEAYLNVDALLKRAGELK